MKRLVYILLISLALFALAACGAKSEKPARAFFDAIENNDFAAARKHTTEQGQQLLEMLESFAENMSEEQKTEMKKTRYKILKTVEEEDSAIVTFEKWNTDSPDEKNIHELKMKKIDGTWKVDLAKEDLDK
ncbi:MAG: DUF4878 domain-containing protein [Candidatus Cloacimonetes bacterium]|jgi:hypothetical protein|nr:DUF4878 domain-containing protein [Candidatus Cloacimonadota bacterium]MDD2422600.1 DUF4878 domain-containing protein [Candidatus Cloacimonadota bacterium]MDD3563208.1 DUF4878 domain-containing protein [Candidatus Cloacimonadota bacterium]MDD4276665.1 DUF4878 domain-containing protein [Candidatus Cloacimonadota bacterium]MDY0324679.1 DUF4878 domain-containing protein [Candidatus Cloacimonadaceae bacterium]